MIISPSFLPARGNDTDEAYLERAMPEASHGSFPVTSTRAWHGGLHLTAPTEGGRALPVRAIADGTVVYVRKPTAMPSDPDAADAHALGYNGWTDDGVVVIRHDTEIGADDQDTPTEVQFFSVYMHLSIVLPAVRSDNQIYRKAEVGSVGLVDGETNILHFEIICDDANLSQLIDRTSGDVATEADGRTDAVYGALYFRLPESLPIHATRPALHEPNATGGAPLCEEMFASVLYAEGDATVTTYRADGTTLGAAFTETNAEYDLYRDSGAIVRAYTNARATTVPAHSAVYELLRFGRVINTPHETLIPEDTPHWRRIRTPTGDGWVNLNATGVYKFSDADAPQWIGWRLTDDYQDGSSRCEIGTLRTLLGTDPHPDNTDVAPVTDPAPAVVNAALKRLVAKFPSEWERANLATRWLWLTQEGAAANSDAGLSTSTYLTDAGFREFLRHAEALAFWEDANLDIDAEHWHFNPKEFIGHFARCRWISTEELARIVPSAAAENIERFKHALNSVMRKYHGENLVRMSHFLGQLVHETNELSGAMVERGNSNASQQYETDEAYFQGPDTYPPFQPGTGYERIRNTLGNEYSPAGTGDGIKFRGRGSLQLTGRANYSEYWVYRAWIAPEEFDSSWWSRPGWWSTPRNINIVPANIPDPQRVSARAAGNEYNPIDVGGLFWVRNSINQACANETISSSLAPRANAVSLIINRYDTPTFTARRNRVEAAKRILCDDI